MYSSINRMEPIDDGHQETPDSTSRCFITEQHTYLQETILVKGGYPTAKLLKLRATKRDV